MTGETSGNPIESLDRQIQAKALALQYSEIESPKDYARILEDLYQCKTVEGINPFTREFVLEAMDDLKQNNLEFHQSAAKTVRPHLINAAITIREMDGIKLASPDFDSTYQVRRILAEAQLRRLSSIYPELIDTISESDLEI